MANKFVANIILCKKITEENEIESLFNNLEVHDENSVKFDVAIFLTADIKEPKEEMFLLNLIFKDKNGNVKYNPLGTFVRNYDLVERTNGISLFRNNKINFVWSGLYDLELRRCEEHKDINTLKEEELIEFTENSVLINSFTFNVELK